MGELTFECAGVRDDPYAAGPTLIFRLRILAAGGERVHAIALRCQLRIEPALRGYDSAEAERLRDLFGDPARWGETLHPMQLATVSVVVPGFTGECEVDVAVPCTYDMDIATSKYFDALSDGEVPLLLLFSGTAFCGPGGFQVRPVPWDKEASFRMPVEVWRRTIEAHFPGCGWIRLPRSVMDELLAYRSRNALPSWDATMRTLLAATGDRQERPAPLSAAAPGAGRGSAP